MHIVLVEPEIPPNTGNIARLCAATNTTLHLVEPLGFRLDDSTLRRAGMDYWRHVRYCRWPNWATFRNEVSPQSALWFVEQGGSIRYSDAKFGMNDYLVFGRETAGLPQTWLREAPNHWLRIPMFNAQARSLNLSNCAALVLFEALRQNGYPDELI
jgi:tRNA (cytidine/uridine-2'-O-)-methyltransferase